MAPLNEWFVSIIRLNAFTNLNHATIFMHHFQALAASLIALAKDPFVDFYSFRVMRLAAACGFTSDMILHHGGRRLIQGSGSRFQQVINYIQMCQRLCDDLLREEIPLLLKCEGIFLNELISK